MQAVSIKFNQLLEFLSACFPRAHMRLPSIYVALLRSSVFFLSSFNIRLAEAEECVGGIHLELKTADGNKRD